MSSDFQNNFGGGLLDNEPTHRAPGPLKNATATLVLGIISIATCWCYGVIGITLGIIAMAISNKPWQEYKQNPSMYTDGQNMRAGRICALIGLILSGLYILFIIGYLIVVGSMISAFPSNFR